MKRIPFVILMAMSGPAAAQQPSPEVQALGSKLMQEINAGIQCHANAVVAREEILRLQAEVKSLKDKYEAKPADSKP